MSPSRKRILIIYTGGTIGMMKTRLGYAPQKEAFHRLLDAIPELKAEGMPEWEITDMDPLLDSSNITVREWNLIGAMIAADYDRFDGFVVLHGTDTMAYTASALSFTLRNNRKPVILTGSQIPLCEIRTDARDNLITAMLVAADDRVHEVCLYFGGKLLRGNRSVKYSADDLIAFESPNLPPLAEAGIACRRVNKVREGRPHVVDMIKNDEISLFLIKSSEYSLTVAHAVRILLARYYSCGDVIVFSTFKSVNALF